MKNAKLFLWLPALAVLVCALSWGQPFAVAQQDRDPAAPAAQQPEQQPEQQPDSSMNQQSDLKTFTGKVMKSGEKLVLKDSASKSTYKLDDQDRAKSFEGRNVKVIGTLDAATSTIRVTSIEMEPGS
jgi:Protein of unknown function (DUF5818)